MPEVTPSARPRRRRRAGTVSVLLEDVRKFEGVTVTTAHDAIIGASTVKLWHQVEKLATEATNMLILGEPGTGKGWMARRYATPFLQVIYNNGGWKSPKLSTLALHPDGHASQAADLGLGFEPAPDHGGIAAAAGGAFARKVMRAGELEEGAAVHSKQLRELAANLQARLHQAADTLDKLTAAGWTTSLAMYEVILLHSAVQTREEASRRLQELGIDPQQFMIVEEVDEDDLD